MRKTAIIFTCLLLALLTGCWEDRSFNALLDGVDSLMERRPDSALSLLQAKADTIGHLPQSQQMRYHLLTAKAQNKAYVDFTTDSLMRVVADYYDHHGSPNDRMMAHYLLGCCYRDMGEAPATIECYKDAVNLADTTRQDCDYRTLMSIYGQIASLYDKQAMPMEELEALERSGWNALKCGDTLNYIRSIQLQTQPYNLLQDTSRIFEVTDRARALFLKHGYVREAAATLPIPIAKKIEAQQYKEAHSMMQIYENQSGRFDKNGNIQPRYSVYYATKGQYYLGLHQLDSAEYYFRKALSADHKYDAFRGLEAVYYELKIADSVFYYGRLAEDALDLMFSEISDQSVRQTERLYDYTRNQRIAHEKELESAKSRTIMLGISFVSFFLLVTAYMYYRRQKRQKELQVKIAMQEVMDLTALYEKSKEESHLAKQNLADFESYKEKEVEELKAQLEQARRSFSSIDQKMKLRVLLDSKIVAAFRNMTIPKPGKQKLPSEKQWSELSNAVKSAMPYFHERISMDVLLSCQEYRVTLLTRLSFTVGEAAILLDTTSQRVTNAKRSANFKLFGEDSAQSFLENINRF